MKVEYINPFISSITTVFSTMLNCPLTRQKIYLKDHHCPEHEISGIIGLSGKAAGTVVLSLTRQAALSAAEALLGERPLEINAEVRDAVGELANMVAGGAKAQLEQFEMSVTIPTVITGRFSVQFPSKSPPICVPFDSEWGALTLEVGLVEAEAAVERRDVVHA
jgi:chemotaxis protein CheX